MSDTTPTSERIAGYQEVIMDDGKTIQRLEAELAETRAEVKDAEWRTLEIMKVRDQLTAKVIFMRRECERLTEANSKYCDERDTLARKYQAALKTIEKLNQAAADER